MADILRKVVGVFSFKDDASKEVDKINASMDEGVKSAQTLDNALKALGGAAVAGYITGIAKDFLIAGANAETANVRLKNLAGEGYAELEKAIGAASEASQGLAGGGDLEEAANQALKYGASVDFVKESMAEMQKLAAITGDDLTSMYQGVQMSVLSGSTKFLKSNALLSKHMEGFKALGSGMDEATKKKRELFILDVMMKESINIQQQYNDVLDTTNGLLDSTNTQWGEVKERLGGILAAGFKPLLKIAKSVLTFLGSTEKGLVVLKVLSIAIAPVIGVVLAGALYTAATAMGTLLGISAPFIAIALAIGAAIAAVVLIVQDFMTWLEGGDSLLGDFFDGVLDTLMQIWEIIKGIFSGEYLLKGGKFIIDAITGKADGGPVDAGTPYMVGEEGPELFVPNRSGSIVPNGAGGGISINTLVGSMSFTVNGPAEAGEAVKTAVLNALNDLSRSVFRAELGLEVG